MTKINDIRNQTNGGDNKRSLSKINKIARHHSATTTGDYFAFWNGRWKGLGWKTGGYHELILRDGSVQLCYDADVITNGIRGHNENTYHICVIGNSSFTDVQEATFNERCLLAMDRFNVSVNDVQGHNEFSGTSTSCPGINMDMVRSRLKVQPIKVEAPKVEVKSEVVVKPSKPKSIGKIATFQDWLNDNYKTGIVVDNQYGSNTKKAAIKALQTELNKQYKAGLKVDGVFGSNSQSKVRTVSKGYDCANITRIIQGMLYCLGYDPKGFDGIFGNGCFYAIKKYQSANKLDDDGKVGKSTFAKLFK